MLNRAPTVYVPVAPEDNGLVAPFLLSLAVHGLAIGFIVLSHHIPSLHTPPSIETSLVTPEELAVIQQQVMANREIQTTNAQSGAFNQLTGQGDGSSSMSDLTTGESNSSSVTNNVISPNPSSNSQSNEVVVTQPSIVERLRNREPVFKRSDAPPDPIDAPSNNNNTIIRRQAADNNTSKPTSKSTTSTATASKTTNKNTDKTTVKPKVNPEVEKLQQQRMSISEAERRFNEELFENEFDKEFDDIKPDTTASNTANNSSKSTTSSQNTQPLTKQKSDSSNNANSGNNSSGKSNGKSGSGASGNGKPAEEKKPTNTLSKGQITHAAFQQISQQWRKPVDLYDTSITMRIPVDTNTGAVKMAQVRRIAGDAALEPSIKAAIRAASPLKSVIGAKYDSLDLEFVINPQ